MELLFDQAFFQMDVPSIVQWEKITDNLIMQDKKAHDEFIGRFWLIKSYSKFDLCKIFI